MFSVCDGASVHHNHGHIMSELNHMGMHYTQELCDEILALNCVAEHKNNVVCGSDDVDYHDQ